MVGDPARERVLHEFEEARVELMAATEGLTEQEATSVVRDGWSIKDHLAHIAHLDELRFFEIHRISQGYQPAHTETAERFDVLNDMTAAVRRSLSLGQILWELEFTRARVLEAIRTATGRGLDESSYREVSFEGGAGHERTHAAIIREMREGPRS